jgi:hypothetical protein
MCEVGGPLVVSCKGFSHFLCLLFFLPCIFFLANVIAFGGATFFLGSSGRTERLRFANLGFLQQQHSVEANKGLVTNVGQLTTKGYVAPGRVDDRSEGATCGLEEKAIWS